MDWERVIERQGRALRQVLAMLVAMAGLGATPTSPLVGEDGEARRGAAETLVEPGEGDTPTLPRRLYRAILAQLRPAEAAARRLIIIVARDITVTLPPPRPRKPKRKSIYVRPGRGTGIVVPWGVRMPDAPVRSRLVSLPLLDPPFRFSNQRRRSSSSGVPRVRSLGGSAQVFASVSPPPKAAASSEIDATRLGLRLAALGRALADLPKQALRFARWKARRAAGRLRRLSPLRPGPAYGRRRPASRRKASQVDDILGDTHYFARLALQPDTS